MRVQTLSRIVALALSLCVLLRVGLAAEPQTKHQKPATRAWKNAVVAADHPAAGAAGIEVMKKGGNVVDAAVATAFALSVVRPESCGMGGGGFMLIWNARTQKAVALDYRERAPKRATRTMYHDPNKPGTLVPGLSRRGHLAIAVPGSVAGWCYAQKHYGRLKLADVLSPALRLARKGVPVDPLMRSMQESLLRELAKDPKLERKYAVLKRLYLNDGKLWQAGDRFYSPQLPALEAIARAGADGFYRGPVADAIVAEVRRDGGIIRKDDLDRVKPVVREPLTGEFRGHRVLTMPPASSGGVALLQTLNTLSAYERLHDVRLEKMKHNSVEYVHLLTEALKHAFADRAEYLGDTDFAKVPVQKLISRRYAKTLAQKIKADRTFPIKYYGRFQPVNDGGTSHFSVIDAHGNAVACTETINLGFGSRVVEPKFGIVLNDEMDDFAAAPGKPNAFGLIQSEANAIAPGKKPLSSMTPTIVLKEGKAVLAVGASGGPRIISSTIQVLLNTVCFGMEPQRAVGMPRFHHQWVPNSILLEPQLDKPLRKNLVQRRHTVRLRSKLSATQAATRSGDSLRGGSDPRKYGQPAGY